MPELPDGQVPPNATRLTCETPNCESWATHAVKFDDGTIFLWCAAHV